MIDLFPNGKVEKDGVVLYEPGSPTYEAFHRDTKTPNILIIGRRGSGKSTAVRWQLHRLALQHEGFRYLVVRNHKTELQRTHLQFLDAEMESLGGVWASTVGEAQYPNGSIGMFAGFEKEADTQKLLGVQLDLLVVEEGTTVSWPVIVDLASTLRATVSSGRVPQLIIPTNPYGPHSLPIKRRFHDKDITPEEDASYQPQDWRLLLTTAADNPHLDFKTYDKRLQSLTPQKRRAWLLGEWAVSEGTFFESFDPDRHVITRLPELNGRSILRNPAVSMYRALDHGFSDDPAVCLWIAVLPSGLAIVVKEMSWKRTPAAEIAHEIIGHSRDMNIVETFADPTLWNGQRLGVQSVADVIELNGVPLTPSVNDRRLYSVNEWLNTTIDGQPRIRLWAEGCPKLIQTFPQQTPNKVDPERMADSRTDHHVITLSYFCSSWATGREPLNAPKPPPFWLQKLQQLEGQRLPLGHESTKH